MHIEPQFTDWRDRPFKAVRPRRSIQWRLTFLALLVAFAPLALMGATTAINLATQVEGILGVGNGGTGASTLTQYNVLLGAGGSAVNFASPGTSGYVLTSNGASANPTFQAAASAPTFYQEVPSGTINGSNTTFTLAHTPASANSVLLFENGVAQTQGGSSDYTISGATITYNTAPPTGTLLLAQYH